MSGTWIGSCSEWRWVTGAGEINTALLRGDEGVPSSSSGRLGLVLQGEELVRPPGAELGLWICDPPEYWSL